MNLYLIHVYFICVSQISIQINKKSTENCPINKSMNVYGVRDQLPTLRMRSAIYSGQDT